MFIGDILDIPRTIVDCTVNNKCSMCGECCSAILPMSNQELKRIKKYVKQHNIKTHQCGINAYKTPALDITCPFRNNEKRICEIYPVRPWICQKFICNNLQHNLGKNVINGKEFVNLRELFK